MGRRALACAVALDRAAGGHAGRRQRGCDPAAAAVLRLRAGHERETRPLREDHAVPEADRRQLDPRRLPGARQDRAREGLPADAHLLAGEPRSASTRSSPPTTGSPTRAGCREEDAKALAANHIPVYYLEAGMHSTEVGPVQVIPNIVHRLATEKSPEINKILNEMLIVLLPAANPDGSHLVTDYFNETAGHELHAHVSGPLPPLHRPRRQPRLAVLHPAGVQAADRRLPQVQAGRRAHPAPGGLEQPAHVGAAVQRRHQRRARRARDAVDQRDRHGRRPRPVRRGQEGRLVRRRVRDLGHGRHPELRDVRGLGAAAVRGRVADATSRTRTRAPNG